jgi:hypothetical protein
MLHLPEGVLNFCAVKLQEALLADGRGILLRYMCILHSGHAYVLEPEEYLTRVAC